MTTIGKDGIRVRVKDGWLRDAGDLGRAIEPHGTLLAEVFVQQAWAVVIWDDREDPSCFKAAGLEIL